MSSAVTAPLSAGAGRLVNLAHRTIDHARWDDALGLLLVLTGLIILSDVVLAGTVSVLLVGWLLLIGGAIEAVLGVFGIREGDSWAAVLSGALSFTIGLVFVRNPTVTLMALSLTVGAVLIAGGIIRLLAVTSSPGSDLFLIVSGVLGIVLGLLILNRWPTGALWLLGTLLGIQIIADGVLIIAAGRPHLTSALQPDQPRPGESPESA